MKNKIKTSHSPGLMLGFPTSSGGLMARDCRHWLENSHIDGVADVGIMRNGGQARREATPITEQPLIYKVEKMGVLINNSPRQAKLPRQLRIAFPTSSQGLPMGMAKNYSSRVKPEKREIIPLTWVAN